MRADRAAVDVDRAGGERCKAHLACAVHLDGADNRSVRENAALTDGAFEAGLGEQLADHECTSLFRAQFLCGGQSGAEQTGAQNARTDNGYAD